MDLVVSRDGLIWRARFGGHSWRCAVGRGGVREEKREGDGATPAGCWPLRRLLYRADSLVAPKSPLPVSVIGPEDAWCDEPGDACYNRPVVLPYAGRHERQWREDGI